MPESTHEVWMQRCIDLGALAGKNTRTNPNVGAVLVYNNEIIGEGYHRSFGGNHAEIEAIESVPEHLRHLIPSSTLYISLEPCCHEGKTPACTSRILKEKIRKVVIGCEDPNPLVAGKGITMLQQAGIDMTVGIAFTETKKLIAPFICNQQKMPYVILKWAESADGFLSEAGKQTWLTNQIARILTHKWRSECDAIMIGKNTAIIDDPELTLRYYPGSNPIRIVMDRSNSLPDSLKFLNDALDLWIINEVKDQRDTIKKHLQTANMNDLRAVLQLLFHEGIGRIIIEGGASLLQSFITAGLWQEARILKSPVRLGQGIKAPFLKGLLNAEQDLGDNKAFFIFNSDAR